MLLRCRTTGPTNIEFGGRGGRSQALQYIFVYRQIGRPNEMTPHTGWRVGAQCGVVISHEYGPLSTTVPIKNCPPYCVRPVGERAKRLQMGRDIGAAVHCFIGIRSWGDACLRHATRTFTYVYASAALSHKHNRNAFLGRCVPTTRYAYVYASAALSHKHKFLRRLVEFLRQRYAALKKI